MIWSHLTVMRNLSYNLSDFAGEYIPHMFNDSKIATSMNLYRQKVQKIISMVLEPYVSNICRKYMSNVCALMVDGSRDISNRNELMIGAAYYNEEKNEIKRTVFEILEQNNTKSQKIYQSLNNLLLENKIPYKSILSVMTDNANDMSAEEGLTGLMKCQNNSIYGITCICHSLNLIIKKLMIFLQSNDLEIDANMIEVESLLCNVTSLFNYSYKKDEQYRIFKTTFLQKKKKDNGNLYPDQDRFNKLSRYSEVRFLSLGDSLNTIIPQWKCLIEFFHDQINNKTTFELNRKQVQHYEEILEQLYDNNLKFFVLIIKLIADELNVLNRIFQKQKAQTHLLFPLSRKLLLKFLNILCDKMTEFHISDVEKLKKYIADKKNFLDNSRFITCLQNYIDFNQIFIEFSVNITNLDEEILEFSKTVISKFCLLMLDHLPIHNKTTEALQLLDPRKRKTLPTNLILFRENLLKKFLLCYEFKNYDAILQEYISFSETDDSELPVKLEKYISSKTGSF